MVNLKSLMKKHLYPSQFRRGIIDTEYGLTEVTQRQCSADIIKEEPEFTCEGEPEIDGVDITSSYCCSEDLCNWEEDYSSK